MLSSDIEKSVEIPLHEVTCSTCACRFAYGCILKPMFLDCHCQYYPSVGKARDAKLTAGNLIFLLLF